MRVTWDGRRAFASGVDRGVLYLAGYDALPWNGLVSVEEEYRGATTESMFIDGWKWADYVLRGNLVGQITALTYPEEFDIFCGTTEMRSGMLIDRQLPKRFDFSYRTKKHDDHHIIHILKNVSAIASSTTASTVTDGRLATPFSWRFVTIPEEVDAYLSTSKIYIDTEYASGEIVEIIEDTLYGTNESSASVPKFDDILELIRTATPLTIVDHGDGTWTATGSDEHILMAGTLFAFVEVEGEVLSENMYRLDSFS